MISVVIPVKNGAATLDATLKGIFGQTLREHLEVIVIDSGSTDATLELVARYPVRLHEIPPAEFNHGATRNLGVHLARGEFVVMTVQDAAPADDQWLEKMLRHFDDPRVAGVCGKQITPHDPDKNPMQWHRPTSPGVAEKRYFADPVVFMTLPSSEKLSQSAWDDVTAIYRRSVLLTIPFRPVMFAEDWVWAHDALTAGLALVHEPEAMVWHYHHQTFAFRFRRQVTIYYHQEAFWGAMLGPDCWWRKVGQSTWHLLKKGPLRTNRRWHWVWCNLILFSAEQASYRLCRLVLALGGIPALERFHQYVCKTPPQAVMARE
jgi:rhamnosyltransferase